MPSLSPGATVPLLLLMGVVMSVAVHQVFLWLGRGREALHPWVVAWCANSLLTPFRFDADDERLLDSFVDQAAIRNASLVEAEGAARRAAEQALAEVKVLTGLLPICSYCKKVRNDGNYWEQIETYVSEHSDAQFSHGICPECRDGVVKDQLESWRGRL